MEAHKSNLAKEILRDTQARRDMMDAAFKPEGQREFRFGSKTYVIRSATDRTNSSSNSNSDR